MNDENEDLIIWFSFDISYNSFCIGKNYNKIIRKS